MPGGLWLIILGGLSYLVMFVPAINFLVLLATLGFVLFLPAVCLNAGFAWLLVSGLRGKIGFGWLTLALAWFGIVLAMPLVSRFQIYTLHKELLASNQTVPRPRLQKVDGVSLIGAPDFSHTIKEYTYGGFIEHYPVSRLRKENGSIEWLAAGLPCKAHYGTNWWYSTDSVPDPSGGYQSYVEGICVLRTKPAAVLRPDSEIEVVGKRQPVSAGWIAILKVYRLEVATPEGKRYVVTIGEAQPYPLLPFPVPPLPKLNEPSPFGELSINLKPSQDRILLGVEGGEGSNLARALGYAIGLEPMFAGKRVSEIERATPSLEELRRH